jgi:YjbE family integral membrane protein
MAGDNVLVVGLAAAGLPVARRHHAVMAGIAGATILRILFALFAVQLLKIAGLLAAGGLLLLWVSWKMYEELRHAKKIRDAGGQQNSTPLEIKPKKLSSAIWQIVVADVSMSLDNVLGVAGVARDHVWVLVAGLSISVVLMGVASTYVARIAARHSWIAYVGLAVVFYTALNMIWDGAQPFLM